MNFKMQKKKHNVLIQNCDLLSIPKGDRWNFTAEPFKVWHHGRSSYKIFEFKKNEKHRIMENNRISFQKKKRNVLASKLRPVKDFKWWTMTLYRSYVKSGNSLAPHNWAHTRVFTS